MAGIASLADPLPFIIKEIDMCPPSHSENAPRESSMASEASRYVASPLNQEQSDHITDLILTNEELRNSVAELCHERADLQDEITRLRATLRLIKEQVDRGHMRDSITADRAFEEIEDLVDSVSDGSPEGVKTGTGLIEDDSAAAKPDALTDTRAEPSA